MERWDLYDQNRHPLGRTAERDAPLEPGEYHLVAAVWTVDREGNILLTRRAPEKKFFPNKWENSGGAVLAGESSLEGALRELREETGICAAKDEIALLGSCREENYFVDTYLVLKREAAPAVTLQPGETADAKWVSLETLDRMISAGKVIEPAALQLAPLRAKLEAAVKELPHAGARSDEPVGAR